jgi:glycosyltransferase involved in cell wall biosynthesis
MPSLTVLICTHNRRALLEKVLASIDAARQPSGWQVGIRVIANACNDDTMDYLAARSGARPLTFEHEMRPGKSHALNRALSTLDGDVVAFVDDDHRVDAGYLEAVCQAFQSEPHIDLLCGRILPDWDGSEPAWVHEQGRYRVYPLPVPRFDLGDEPRTLGRGTAIPGGGNLAARTGWLERIGLFSVELGPQGHDLGGAEDIDWILRGLTQGAHLAYRPQMIQYHYVDGARLQTSYVVRKAFHRSSSSARVDRIKPAVYMIRKCIICMGSVALSLDSARRRHYLVRFAAALGELHGALKNR